MTQRQSFSSSLIRKHWRRGFTLLEALFAFLFVTLVLSAVYRLAYSNSASTVHSTEAVTAHFLLKSKMEELLSQDRLETGRRVEKLSESFRTVTTVSRASVKSSLGVDSGYGLFIVEMSAFPVSDVEMKQSVAQLSGSKIQKAAR